MTQIKTKIKELKLNSRLEIKKIKEKTRKEIFDLKGKTFKATVQNAPKRYSIGEEIASSITHGIGAGLSIAALVLLIVKAAIYAPNPRALYVTSFAIFGSTLFVLYMMSTLYHALTPYGAKKFFQVADHASIYLLIAGTYTPFCLTILKGAWGWSIFGVIWGLAVIGITLYAIFQDKVKLASCITYILMGYLIVLAFRPMLHFINKVSLKYLLLGGLAYTVGAVFYTLKKIKWMHCVWHVFVMLGSLLHFFAIFFSI